MFGYLCFGVSAVCFWWAGLPVVATLAGLGGIACAIGAQAGDDDEDE